MCAEQLKNNTNRLCLLLLGCESLNSKSLERKSWFGMTTWTISKYIPVKTRIFYICLKNSFSPLYKLVGSATKFCFSVYYFDLYLYIDRWLRSQALEWKDITGTKRLNHCIIVQTLCPVLYRINDELNVPTYTTDVVHWPHNERQEYKNWF